MLDAAHHARPTRKLVGVVLGAVAALAVPLISTTTALGAPSSLATQIVFDVQTADEPLPLGAPGAIGNLYVVVGKHFTVQLSFTDDDGNPAPLTNGGRTAVSVEYENTTIASFTVPGGATETEPKLVDHVFEEPTAGVVFGATAATKPTALTDSSEAFDVLLASGLASQTSLTSINRGGVSGAACVATVNVPICADLVPGMAAVGEGLLSVASCEAGNVCKAADVRADVVQALLPLKPFAEILSSPATLVMKCDKTLCGVGPIQQQTLEVVIRPRSDAIPAPACPSKGTVAPYIYDADGNYTTANAPFCVDYVQSTRDNAGDTVLHLLFVEDAKVRFL